MAGIYVHIPFCKSRCVYCGFFSTTALSRRDEYVSAVVKELGERRGFLCGEAVSTIYFGGGTPSLLPPGDIARVLDTTHNIYNVRERAEITIEGNPDDLRPTLLRDLRAMGVNRLSMGVQTFDDARLRFLHRRHTSAQAIEAVRQAQAAGFDNISVDLMFGFPNQTFESWQDDVRTALSLGVQHISAYSLMYEDGTPLSRMLERGEVSEADEELSLRMYEHLIDTLTAAGFRHYELSNFALPHHESAHNSSYWHGTPYLGVGAGAHSYDGRRRFARPDSLQGYLDGAPLEEETLTDEERYDEYVFTGLRTAEGISLNNLETKFGKSAHDYCLACAQPHIQSGRLVRNGDTLTLSRQGLFVSNDIMADLMQVGNE